MFLHIFLYEHVLDDGSEQTRMLHIRGSRGEVGGMQTRSTNLSPCACALHKASVSAVQVISALVLPDCRR